MSFIALFLSLFGLLCVWLVCWSGCWLCDLRLRAGQTGACAQPRNRPLRGRREKGRLKESHTFAIFLTAAALAKAVAAVSRAALVKSQLSKIDVPSPLVRKSRSYCHFVRFTVLLERDFTQCLSAPKNILTFFSAW